MKNPISFELQAAEWQSVSDEVWRPIAFAEGTLYVPKNRDAQERTVSLALTDRSDYLIFRQLNSSSEHIDIRAHLKDNADAVVVRDASVYVSDFEPWPFKATGHADD